jgi:spore coat polysaccharide biosynthesis protein SpsF
LLIQEIGVMINHAIAILQARTSSSRLPNKVLEEISGVPMILRQIDRIAKAKRINKLIVATSDDSSDDALVELLERHGVQFFRGPLENVFLRFLAVIDSEDGDYFVRLTGDCPLVMPEIIDDLLESFDPKTYDYMSNTIEPSFPDGLDIEVFTRASFLRLQNLAVTKEELEHVTLAFHRNKEKFKLANFSGNLDRSNMRWTVDYFEDLTFVQSVFSHFKGQESTFGYEQVLEFLSSNTEVTSLISASRRNEALMKPQEGHN